MEQERLEQGDQLRGVCSPLGEKQEGGGSEHGGEEWE